MNFSVESLARIGQLPARQHDSHAVQAAQEPFSASQLLQYLRQRGARISYTSVYRILALLVRAEELDRVILTNGEAVHFPADDRERTLWICPGCRRVRPLLGGVSTRSLRERIRKEGLSAGAALVQIQSACSDREACRDRMSSHAGARSLAHIWPAAASRPS